MKNGVVFDEEVKKELVLFEEGFFIDVEIFEFFLIGDGFGMVEGFE